MSVPELELTAHAPLCTEYVIAPSPDVVAPELGVTGELLKESDVLVGAHVTVCVANCTEIVIALLVADA